MTGINRAGPGISAGQSGALGIKQTGQLGDVATRMFGGRMQSVASGAVTTYQITCALSQHFDAVRLIFANISATISPYVTGVAVSVIANTSDLNNSAGTWVAGTKEGQSTFPLETAPNGNGHRKGWTLTDWIPISSIARDDGGTYPLVVARCIFNSAVAALSVYGAPGDDFTNWATKPDGRIWAARNQNVSGVATPANFTSTTNRSNSPIIGIQYLARGRVVTVMTNGDSISEGLSTYKNEGFVQPAALAASNMSGIAVEYFNLSWAGDPQGSLYNGFGFVNNALDVLENDDLVPDIIVLPNASPNDVTGAPPLITSTFINNFRQTMDRLLGACKQRDVAAIVWTWLPTNTSVKAYGATDSLRVAYNAEVLTWRRRGIAVADLSALISGIDDGTGQIQMTVGLTDDGIHPNDAGNVVLAAGLAPYIRQTIG